MAEAFGTQLNEKMLSKRDYKTLGTTIINNPMSPPSLVWKAIFPYWAKNYDNVVERNKKGYD